MPAVVADAKRIVWFGGQLGLSRYSGKHFVYYTTGDGVLANKMWTLLIDRRCIDVPLRGGLGHPPAQVLRVMWRGTNLVGTKCSRCDCDEALTDADVRLAIGSSEHFVLLDNKWLVRDGLLQRELK